MTSNADIVLDQFTRQTTPFADIPVIRRMFEDSLADDGLGMKTRRKGDKILLSYPIAIPCGGCLGRNETVIPDAPKARSGIHGPIERNALRIGYMGPGSRCARPG